MMKMKLLIWLLAACCLLSSCTRETSLLPASTLPPVANPVSAPVGDAALLSDMTAALYLPSTDDQRLICRYETVSFNRGRHPAEAVMRALLASEGSDTASSLGGQVKLQLSGSNPVEMSGGVCTVHLGTSALQLDAKRFYTMSQAIAATLCELPGITAVNVLCGDQAVALDVSDCLPLGCISPHLSTELPVLWEQFHARRTPLGASAEHTPLTSAAALYFPLADGSGVAAEARSLSFEGQSPRQMALTLLAALSAGARTLSTAALMPDLPALLTEDPKVQSLPEGGKRLTLRFSAVLDRVLRAYGTDLTCLAASLTLTLTTYIPGVSAVQLIIDNSAVTSLYNPALGSYLFASGVMRRADFAACIKQPTTLFFPQDGQLTAVSRAMPDADVRHPRALLLALTAGPRPQDNAMPLLPAGLTDADILGVAIQGDTLLINLSGRYAQAIRDSGLNQQLMAQGLTATLCPHTGTSRLRIFFGGMPVDSLNDSLCWSGEFLYSPSLTDTAGGT